MLILEMRRHQAEASLEHGLRAGGAGAAKKCGDNSVLRRPSRMQEFRLRAVYPAFQDSGGEAARDTGGVGEFFRAEAEQVPARYVVPKVAKRPVGWKPRLWNCPGATTPVRHDISLPSAIARNQRRLPETASTPGQRDRGGYRRTAHMDDRFVVRIVVFERLRDRAIRESRRGDSLPIRRFQSAGLARRDSSPSWRVGPIVRRRLSVPASARPITSSMRSLVDSTTSAGISRKSSECTQSANRAEQDDIHLIANSFGVVDSAWRFALFDFPDRAVICIGRISQHSSATSSYSTRIYEATPKHLVVPKLPLSCH